jgi:hypothetical protein
MSVTSYMSGPTRWSPLGSRTVAMVAIGVVACSSTTMLESVGTAPTSVLMPDLVWLYGSTPNQSWIIGLDRCRRQIASRPGKSATAVPDRFQTPALGDQLNSDSRITL